MGRSVTTKIVSTVAGKTGDVSLDVADVSGAAPLASPTLTGIPKAPTAPVGTSTEQLATTEFVSKIAMSAGSVALTNAAPSSESVGATSSVGSSSAAARSDHVHAMPGTATTAAAGFMSAADKTKLDGIETGAQVNDVTSVAGRTGAVTLSVSDISGAAPSASPSFTGTPTAPTAAVGTNTTQVATTAFVKAEVANNITSGTPAAETVGAAGTVGTSSAAARSDHVHAMPGTATTAAAGFMSAADKTKLDGVASGAAALGTSAGSALGTASAGSATTAAKSDHVHPLPTLQALGAAASSHTHDLSEASVKYAATAGRAYPARADGVAVNFNWASKTGQPQWVWGANDGQNEAEYYVYNPSNFSVDTARNLRPGANMGIIWDNDAFGGSADTASITLESNNPNGTPAQKEAMRMRFKLTNDADDIFEFSNRDNDGSVNNDAMTMNGYVVLNAANIDKYAPTRLLRSDGNDPYYIQHTWDGNLWRIAGYNPDGSLHSGASVARADSAGSADSIPWSSVSGKPGLATASADGFMSAGDKTKINGIVAGASKIDVVYAFTALGVAVDTLTPETVICSISLTATGGDIFIMATAEIYPGKTWQWSGDTQIEYYTSTQLRLYRGNTLLYEIDFDTASGNVSGQKPFSRAFIDTPPQGALTYTLRIVNANNDRGVAVAYRRGLTCIQDMA